MFVDHVRLYTRGAHEHGSSLEVAFEQGQVEWSLNTIYLRIHQYLYNLYRFNSTSISYLLRYLPLTPDSNPSDLSSQILNKYRLNFIPARIIKIPSLNFNANSTTVKYVLVYCIAIPNTRAIHPHPPQISVSVPHQNSVLDLVANNLRLTMREGQSMTVADRQQRTENRTSPFIYSSSCSVVLPLGLRKSRRPKRCPDVHSFGRRQVAKNSLAIDMSQRIIAVPRSCQISSGCSMDDRRMQPHTWKELVSRRLHSLPQTGLPPTLPMFAELLFGQAGLSVDKSNESDALCLFSMNVSNRAGKIEDMSDSLYQMLTNMLSYY
ncbi:hypothetical protein K438DRAFT_1764332 [Mycena galopus ATCC 62051]|nr:hypothetical protein K438DRAFT_1764332 [Mycena galopus ATCC 62051]